MQPHTVIAYRYGDLNGHSYLVGSYPDFESARHAADVECEYRGGKYGVSVCTGQGAGTIEGVIERVYHAPSLAGESGPSINLRLTYAEMIGQRIMCRDKGEPIEDIVKYVDELIAHLDRKEGEA